MNSTPTPNPRTSFAPAAAHPPQFKNLVGTLYGFSWLPADTKVTDSYWKIEDLRTALRARLVKT